MDKFFTTKEAAKIFQRHPATIRRWIDQGFLESVKVRTGYLIPETEVERLTNFRGKNVSKM